MEQLSRLIATLTLLKSKRILTAKELAEKFEVSVRTVYRDIRKLEHSGVPIVTIEGRGYSLMDGYVVAPVQFTEKEANALITAAHLVSQTQDTSFVENFESAFTKIKSVFRTSIQEKSELLHRNIRVFRGYRENISSNALAEIQLAITNFKYIEVNYCKANDTQTTFRKIEPYSIYVIHQKWILIAWCHLRATYRSFRIDRIQHFKVLSEHFDDRKFDLQTYFQECPYRNEAS